MRLRTWIVAPLALLLVWLIVRTATIDTLAESRPDIAMRLAPGDPTALIAASGYGTSAPRPVTAVQLALLDRSARSDPLYPEPFLAHAVQAAAQGDDARAIHLGEAARARDPRWLATHAFLLREYARQGNLPAAVAAMNPLAALAGVTGPALADALTTVAEDPKGASVIAAALRSNPRWRGYFVRRASGPGQSLAFRTLVAAPAGVSDADQRDDRAAFLSQLAERGEYERAYLAWINFLPKAQVTEAAAIYDGDFRGLPGLPPFNWTLTSNAAATAERRSDSALPGGTAIDVNFFGGDATPIATELLLTPPGTYDFTMMGTLDGGGPFAGSLIWSLTCLPSRATIPLATLRRFDGHPFRVHTPVTIPTQGCTAQQLSLAGDPGEVATLIHAQFSGLRLVA